MCVLCKHKKYTDVFFPPNVDVGVVIELEQVNYPEEEDMEEVEVCAVLVSGELNRTAVVTMSTIPLDTVEAGSGESGAELYCNCAHAMQIL